MKYKKINSLSQYNEYCNIHERLFQTDLKKDQDEIELLEVLIQDYDNRNNQSQYHELNPVELLKSLLENGDLSQADFSKKINISRQLVSDILNYRRNISKDLVIKLADFFAMKQEAFSRPYLLKNVMSYANQSPSAVGHAFAEEEKPYKAKDRLSKVANAKVPAKKIKAATATTKATLKAVVKKTPKKHS